MLKWRYMTFDTGFKMGPLKSTCTVWCGCTNVLGGMSPVWLAGYSLLTETHHEQQSIVYNEPAMAAIISTSFCCAAY